MSSPIGLSDLPHELQTYLVEFLDPRALVAVQTALPAQQARQRAQRRLIEIRQALRHAQQVTDRQMEAIYGEQFGRLGC